VVIAVVAFTVLGPVGASFATETLGLAGTAAAVVAGATTGILASVVSQGIGVAIGIQDSFSWKSVALAGISGGISGGLGGGPVGEGKFATTAPVYFEGLGATGGAIARAAVGNALTQGVGIAVGLQSGFNWRGVVASGAAAGVSELVTNGLGGDRANFGVNLASQAASSVTQQLIQNGRVSLAQVAVDGFGNALGISVAESIKSTIANAKLTSALNKTGVPYSIDANGRVQADLENRASFNFVQGALETGADVEQIRQGLDYYGNEINQLNQAPGTLGDDVIGSRVMNALRPAATGYDLSGEVITVVGQRTGPSGDSILASTIAGGAELLSKTSELYNEHPFLATALYGGVRGVLGGGPVKAVALELARVAESSLVSGVSSYVTVQAQTAAESSVFDYASRKNLSFDITAVGQTFNIGPEQIAAVAGQFVGGVVQTLLDGTIQGIARRGATVNNIVRPGDTGRYGDLAPRSIGDGLQVDHIPSHASNVRAAEASLQRRLTAAENAELKRNGGAIVVSDRQHMDNSRTYGGRNNAGQQIGDSIDPMGAIDLDMARHIDYLRAQGRTQSEIRAAIQDLIKHRNDLIPPR
jgi:hypothetical protein